MGLTETRALEERYLMRTYKRGAVDFVRADTNRAPSNRDADAERPDGRDEPAAAKQHSNASRSGLLGRRQNAIHDGSGGR